MKLKPMELTKHIVEAKHHLAEAKHWGYSPDPWAQVILDLSDRVGELTQLLIAKELIKDA